MKGFARICKESGDKRKRRESSRQRGRNQKTSEEKTSKQKIEKPWERLDAMYSVWRGAIKGDGGHLLYVQ